MSAKHTQTISDEVKQILLNSQILEDRVILPEGQLDRKVYQQVIKVLESFGAKWNKKEKAILFPVGSKEKLLQALEVGETIREKVVLQAFYTPEDVARQAAELLGEDHGDHSVLEPSCGEGALLKAVLTLDPQALFTVYDINPESITIIESKYADKLDLAEAVDFLKVNPPSGDFYDYRFYRIIMNPPYQKGQAQKHLIHALKFLESGGVLVAIMPQNWRTSEVEAALVDSSVEEFPLPKNSFKESGTAIDVVIVRISA